MSCTTQDSTAASPKTTRSSSISERRPLVPVTPQRNNRANRIRVVSSPLTPSHSTSSVMSSPFTPITNVYSSSSSIASPNSSVSTKIGFSPEPVKARRKSIADSTHNWRSRAKENGIKVDNDEFSYDSIATSFLSTHRRSRQTALFQSNSADNTVFLSPKATRAPGYDTPASAPIPSSLASSVFNTPESNGSLSSSFTLATPSPRSSLAIVQRLRQRGSATDPARPRRRNVTGPIFGETLFDIDEDSITNAPFPESFGSPIALRGSEDSFGSKRSVSAPFIATRFYEGEGYGDDGDDDLEDDGLPVGHISSTRPQSFSSQPTAASERNDDNDDISADSCSVCSASFSPLSVLVPCEHLVCSSCLTSSLNIVGEKDLRCATCDKPVDNFRLLAPLKISIPSAEEDGRTGEGSDEKEKESGRLLPSAIEDLLITRDSEKTDKEDKETTQKVKHVSAKLLTRGDASEAAVLRIDNVPWDITPSALKDFFSPYALERAHVLLDPKGKTLSHAYIELSAAEVRDALRNVQNKSLGKGRRLRGVTVTMSSQSELMRALFPSWLGGFDGVHPTLDGLDRAAMVRTLKNGLITLPEIDGLLTLMKNPKSHFLKVPTLPFYSLVSLLSKFPADGDSRVFWSSKLRDILYGAASTACDLLVERVNTEFHDQDALEQVVATATDCRLFTGTQRLALHSRIIDAIGAKGGQISCVAPDICLSFANESRISDENVSCSSTSTTSIRAGKWPLPALGYGKGKPSAMRPNINSFPYNGTMPFSTAFQSGYTEFNVPQMTDPSDTGSTNRNLNIGLPLHLNRGPTNMPYDVLAREFNVEPDLVAALAQRLAYTGKAMRIPGVDMFYIQQQPSSL